MRDERGAITNQSGQELQTRETLSRLMAECPIGPQELPSQLGLFINRQAMSRLLFMHELYQQILDVHGIVAEFGVRWGQNLSLFSSFRGIYEPFNYNRKIVGFDTFGGFPGVHEKDGASNQGTAGAFAVTEGYERYLEELLTYHEQQSPVAHLKKFELVKGDACETIRAYLDRNPETIIALAYFDFDIYQPTKECLEAIKGHLTKGSVLGFDELNHHDFPGETLAVKEVLGLDTYRIRHSRYDSRPCYLVIE